MAKKAETIFKEHVQKCCKALPNTWALKTQERTIRGIPDLLFCIKGHFIAIELKNEGEEPDALQRYNLDLITRAGGMAVSVTPKIWPDVYRTLIDLSVGKLVFRPQTEDLEKEKHEKH